MSLVGNLEDLSLGDLLQIVSLSQKSGVLAIESGEGSGRILFRGGLVHAAGIKGRTPESDAIARHAGPDAEPSQSTIRAAAEAAIFEMFGWSGGEFHFEARGDGEGELPYPYLNAGLNAQFLAMEGTRLRDEAQRSRPPAANGGTGAPASTEARLEGEAAEFFFGSEPLEIDGDGELELDAIVVEGAVANPPAPSAQPLVEASAMQASDAVDVVVERTVERTRERAGDESVGADRTQPPSTAASALETRPVVVIEPDAAALEWVRSSLEGRFARIHVFQRAEQGLARIRQYLIRGEVPCVLISLTAPIDPLSGIHGLADFVKRLRVQAPKITIAGLRESSGAEMEVVPASFDGVLPRPTQARLAKNAGGDTQVWRERFESHLARLIASRPGDAGRAAIPTVAESPSRPESAASPASASGPHPLAADDAASLRQARSPAETFALALDAAARSFARVAVLALRGNEAVVVAARGIETVPEERGAGVPSLAFAIGEASLLHRIVEEKCALRASPQGPADRGLVELFGPIEPKTAYYAPIVVADRVAAILYADQGAQRRPLPDTTGLEKLLARAAERLTELAGTRAPSGDPA